MRQLLRSFVAAYVVVPIVFYSVDAALHIGWPHESDWWIIGLNVSLLAATTFSFLALYRLRTRLRIQSPFGAALGASLGLVHWFPIYAIVGTALIRNSDQTEAFLLSPDELYLAVLNFVVPVFTLSGGTYDGSRAAIVASPVLLFAFAALWRVRQGRRFAA